MIEMIFGIWVLLQAAVPGAPGKPLDAAQAKPASVEPQDPDRAPISAVDLKALRDNNVFSPHTKRRTPPPSYGSRPPSTPRIPPKPKPPAVTGIFFDVKTQDYLVIVEDRNEASLKFFKEPKFLKAGDEVLGIKVQSVTAEKAVFMKGDVSKEAHVGEPLPETDAKPVSSALPADDSELADDEDPAVPATAGTPSKTSKRPPTVESKTGSESKSTDTRPSSDVLEELKKKNMKRRTRPGE